MSWLRIGDIEQIYRLRKVAPPRSGTGIFPGRARSVRLLIYRISRRRIFYPDNYVYFMSALRRLSYYLVGVTATKIINGRWNVCMQSNRSVQERFVVILFNYNL